MTTFQTRIILVEDDSNFGDVLKSYLEMNDFEVTLVRDGLEGLNKVKKHQFDLAIFDVMLPKLDGFRLAEEVKKLEPNMPIIFLTAKSMQDDVLTGLKLGADDYMTKPFNSEELLLRIQAVLKRAKSNEPELEEKDEYELGGFVFNYPLRTLKYKTDGKNVKDKLSPKEAQLLKMFCQYKNDVLTRSKALTTIWGEDNYFTARSMDVFVTKLRKYLKKDPDLEIVNIHGNGFRLIDKTCLEEA